MKPRTINLISFLVAAALVASTRLAISQTEILTFDDLPNPVGNGALSVPNGYGGLQWQNFFYLDGLAQSSNSGYEYGVVSPNNVAYNTGGNPALFGGTSFNLNSAYLTAAWNDGLQVEAQGFVGGVLTFDNIYTINTAGPTLVHFNYAGVNEVNFISSGGTPNGGLAGNGTQFVMDNLSITILPAPTTVSVTISSIGNGDLQIIASGPTGPFTHAIPCILQSTTDFVNWIAISTNFFPTDGLVTNIVQTTNSMTFYRVEVVSP